MASRPRIRLPRQWSNHVKSGGLKTGGLDGSPRHPPGGSRSRSGGGSEAVDCGTCPPATSRRLLMIQIPSFPRSMQTSRAFVASSAVSE